MRHDHAAFSLDGPNAQGAVATGAGQHDADGAFALILGQRPEEKVYWQTQSALREGFQQLQGAVYKRHVAVGRDNVDAIGFYRHAVFDFNDGHAGAVLNKFGEQAFVVGCQVLNQNKGHAGVNVDGHAGKERLKSRQAPRRGTDADNGESGGRCRPRL